MSTATHDDRLVAILLCSDLAGSRGAVRSGKPLSATQWHTLVAKLSGSAWSQPSGLLGQSAAAIERTLAIKPESAERVSRLLECGGQAAIELERLAAAGIWTLTEFDTPYPTRLRQRLGAQAPPVLFGAGAVTRLNNDSVAVVGSRHVEIDGGAFAHTLGALCQADGLTVVTGAARGVDGLAMHACLARGGTAVGIVAGGLESMVREPAISRYIRDERLVLMTAVHPAVHFHAGNAMARNKLIYGCAELAIVVASAVESGGTWAGAVENLKHGWVPLFVRNGTDVPAGNHALLQRGAFPLSLETLPPVGALLPGLFAQAGHPLPRGSGQEGHTSTDAATAPPALQAAPEPTASDPSPAAHLPTGDLFPVVWPSLAALLAEPRLEREVAAAFAQQPAQVKAWLARAVAEGRAEAIVVKGRRTYQTPRARLL
ncbi:MAG: DNA-processing protein DprA [Chloroflexota bacterium]|nr:DNA-processing protein DprA [Chloroflexota bacterium]